MYFSLILFKCLKLGCFLLIVCLSFLNVYFLVFLLKSLLYVVFNVIVIVFLFLVVGV